MPVAALLGKEPKLLNRLATNAPCILPDHIVFIGPRSYEPPELTLLSEMGVKIFFMHDVLNSGLEYCFNSALNILKEKVTYFGISIDMDAFDPIDAPGVGTPEKNGIRFNEFYPLYEKLVKHSSQLIALRFVSLILMRI